jgi:hypothetical protein
MPDTAVLLHRHVPLLRYDSQEDYFADSAAIWTDNPSNVLRGKDGKDRAVPNPTGAQAKLALDFLAPATYADKSAVTDADTIADTDKEYAEEAKGFHLQSEYAHRVYGRAQRDSRNRLWLQYWYFYFYNEANRTAGFGKHEGDWEMVQILIEDDDETPDVAVYAQHDYADWRSWNGVEKAPDSGDATPIVYSALGSHASYFTPGTHPTVPLCSDRANGQRQSPPSTLVIVGDEPDPWLLWPGYWGDTRRGGTLFGLIRAFSDSPRGPCRHDQWFDPVTLLAKAERRRREQIPARAPLATSPQVMTAARTSADTLRLEVQISKLAPGTAAPVALMVTANSPEDRLPPQTTRVDLPSDTSTVEVPVKLAPGLRYELQVSGMSADGVPSAAVPVELPA